MAGGVRGAHEPEGEARRLLELIAPSHDQFGWRRVVIDHLIQARCALAIRRGRPFEERALDANRASVGPLGDGQTARSRRPRELVAQVGESTRQLARCRCHGPGPEHGPHLQIGWPGDNGKTTGCYVPIAAQPRIREGAKGGQEIQDALREPGAANRDAISAEARAAKATAKAKRPTTSRETNRPTRRDAGTGA